ncbi:MAG: SAM-dependent chlorinase/fluorinase [Desulfobacterales bacterium]|nr:SAM-dependent chlorinase/fluorinase [Desulfobacterales bacterium]
MSIISLLTDFGFADEYVGVMKGVILSINPAAVIVDISHRVEPQGILQAAFLVKSAYRFFPDNTIHVIVVDPGVGSDRAILAYEKDKHIFIAPDNGVLSLLLDETGDDKVIRIENSDYFLKPVSQTFHGRDIVAPVAAYLSRGTAIAEFGPELDLNEIIRLPIPKACITEAGTIVGSVISIDHFGNLITNIDLNMLTQYGISEKKAVIVLGDVTLKGVMPNYVSAKIGHPLVITGSRGYLEIAVNKGSARAKFNVAIGDTVRIGLDD